MKELIRDRAAIFPARDATPAGSNQRGSRIPRPKLTQETIDLAIVSEPIQAQFHCPSETQCARELLPQGTSVRGSDHGADSVLTDHSFLPKPQNRETSELCGSNVFPGLSYRGVQASIMRCTMCKAWRTLMLTLPKASATVDSSGSAEYAAHRSLARVVRCGGQTPETGSKEHGSCAGKLSLPHSLWLLREQ